VRSDSVRVHVRSLLAAIGHRYKALEQLQTEGYFVSLMFFDTKVPKPTELAAISAKLEKHGISFDFELEREDFPG
jgi:hypothetical protein